MATTQTPESSVFAGVAESIESNDHDAVKTLTKEQITAAQDIKYEIVDVPEWGGKVRVAVMKGPDRDGFELSCIKGKGKLQKFSFDNIRAKLAAFTIVDDSGKRMFADNEINLLAAKSGAALDRVWSTASRLNGITREDVEELAGNSDSGPSDDS